MSAHVVLDSVTKRYSKAHDSGGVFDVDTVVPGGKFTTLLGESGSGKTTLLRLLAGFLRPDSGSIVIGDRPVATETTFVPTQARDLAMVFQNYALWPHMTVFDIVAFGLRARKIDRAQIRTRVHEALSVVGLADYGRRRPSQLSGGQQQRVALARSLVIEPSLLLLDEPLSNLDADLRVQMRDQLKSLQLRTGITFVYVTHDQEEAFALSDHMIVLDHGRVLQQGDCHQIYARPRTTKVAEFMGRRGLLLDGRVDDASAFVTSSAAGLSLGSFPHVDERLKHGGRASLIVHSEDLALCTADRAPSGQVLLPATVTAINFAGRENHVMVSTDDGGQVTTYSPHAQTWSPGQRVQLSFSREAAWIFPCGGAEPEGAAADLVDTDADALEPAITDVCGGT